MKFCFEEGVLPSSSAVPSSNLCSLVNHFNKLKTCPVRISTIALQLHLSEVKSYEIDAESRNPHSCILSRNIQFQRLPTCQGELRPVVLIK